MTSLVTPEVTPGPARAGPLGPKPSAAGTATVFTFAPGGGVNGKLDGSGRVNDSEVYPTLNAGLDAPRAKICTWSGSEYSASMAILTWPISDRLSLGASESWYAAWPAIVTLDCSPTVVVVPTAARICRATCCGVGALGTGVSWAGPVPDPAGSTMWVAWLVRLSQIQTSRPSRRRSASPRGTGIAILTRAGPSYQIRKLCVPDSSDSPDSGSAVEEPGSAGRPRFAVSWTVACRADGSADLASTAASSCAVLRAGSCGAACAPASADPAMTSPTAATAPAGAAQRAWRGSLLIAPMATSGGYPIRAYGSHRLGGGSPATS